MDTRNDEVHVESHNANRVPALSVRCAEEILSLLDQDTQVIGIDEVQFFSSEIIEVCDRLVQHGFRVICCGLDLDFRGRPFGPMPQLLALGHSITKLHAVCMACGDEAIRSQRMNRDTSLIAVGADDSYEARCLSCYRLDGAGKK